LDCRAVGAQCPVAIPSILFLLEISSTRLREATRSTDGGEQGEGVAEGEEEEQEKDPGWTVALPN
jgi:hypothetical protein